ncbi:MAG: DUF4157 domain-containing protein [Acidobacteriota bacterium]
MSSGSPLPESERSFFEPRFGADLSGVRVHTGAAAQRATSAVQARAFALGSDMVFGAGEYRPGSTAGRRLIAHELTHTLQQGAIPGSAAESRGGQRIQPYRDKGKPNFGACDTDTMKEKEFEKGDPWIESIVVHYDGVAFDVDGQLIPTGQLVATYKDDALAQITAAVTGGVAIEGLTDSGTHTVKRVEGCGYHHLGVPKDDRVGDDWPENKYFTPDKRDQATMNYAVFFLQGKSTGNQAVHQGDLDSGSLACVHVGGEATMRQISYHSRRKHTTVTVSYESSVLEQVCCERQREKGKMPKNPCGSVDKDSC